MIKLSEDMHILTTIPEFDLLKLFKIESSIIAHQVVEDHINGEEFSAIDLGIGKLYIRHSEDALQYKFMPAKAMEDMIIDGIDKNESPLVKEAEQLLVERIMNTYKELL